MILKKSVGRYTKLVKGGQVIHHMPKHNIERIVAPELWELSTIRFLRHLFAQKKIANIQEVKTTLFIYLANVLTQVLRHSERNLQVHNYACTFSAVLEGLKLFHDMEPGAGEGKLCDYHAHLVASDYEDGFRFLHDAIEESSIVDIHVHPEDPVQSGRVSDILKDCGPDSVVFLNTLKCLSHMTGDVLSLFQDNPDLECASVLLTFHCSSEEPKKVCNVLTEEFTMPYLYHSLDLFAKAGWLVHYLYDESFDRGYLLPFEGEAGIAVVHLTRDESLAKTLSENTSLKIFENAIVQEKAISVFDSKLKQEYDSAISWEFPVVKTEPDRDWKNWNPAEGEIDPAQVDWSQHPLENHRSVLLKANLDRDDLEHLSEDELNKNLDEAIGLFNQGKLDPMGCIMLASYFEKQQELVSNIIKQSFKVHSAPDELKFMQNLIKLYTNLKVSVNS